MTIRLTSKDDKLNASFTEMKKPIIALYFGDNSERNMNAFEFYLEQFESSFKPIQLSEGAEKYFKEFDITALIDGVELSAEKTEMFEMKELISNAIGVIPKKTVYVLHLEEPVVPVNAVEDNQKELLIQLGKDILKHQEEMLLYNSFRSSVVLVADIIKCFDKLGVKIEDEFNF